MIDTAELKNKTGLDRIHVIDRNALSGKDYLVSLLVQGQLCSLISDLDAKLIQNESILLLTKQVEKWSHGKSSSIPAEKAGELLESILYTAGLALKAYASPEDAIDALKKEGMEYFFELGQKKIGQKLQILCLLQRSIKSNLFQTNNVFYRATVVDGINGFFKLYDPKFSAQEIHITADYPVFLSVTDLRGIEFIENYLQNIACENRFCRYFSANRVHQLLCGLDENYRQILMNIYEPVLTAALCCLLTERPARELCCDLKAAQKLFNRKDAKEIEALLISAADKLTAEFKCPDGLKAYIGSSLHKLALSIERGIRLGHPETVILTPSCPEEKPRIIFSYGERMPDREYSEVLEELMNCESADAKGDILLQRINSLGDMIEILRDAEFTQEELLAVFRRFTPEMIAALMASYPNRDFLYDERESNIYAALQQFNSMLPTQVAEQLQKAAKALKLGKIV